MIRLGRLARDLLEASIVALLLGLLVRTFVVQMYRVPSSSMEPLLRAGDYVLVNKLLVRQGRQGRHGGQGGQGSDWPNPWLPQRPVARGDVLVFPHPQEPGRLLVKRCLAGSGERVHIQDKALFVARERLEEPYVEFRDNRVYPASSFLPEAFRVRDQFGPLVVSEGGLFCLGDNRDFSLDSRHWGPVERRSLLGQAVFAVRPPATIGSASATTSDLDSADPMGSSSQSPGGWRAVRVR